MKRGEKRGRPAETARPSRAGAWAEAVVWLLVLVVPVVLVPAAREGFRLPKLLVGEWLGLLSLVPLAWRLRHAGRVGPERLAGLPALRAVVPVLAVAAAGLASSGVPVVVREALWHLAIGAALLVGWSAGLEAWRLERLTLGALLVPAPLLTAVAAAQEAGFDMVAVGFGEAGREDIVSLAGNPADLADFLVLAATAAAVVALAPAAAGRLPPSWRRGAAAAVFCASVYGLALSRTITAVVALAAGLAVAVALLARWGRRPRRAVLVGTAAAGVLAVALLVAFPLGPRLGRKLADLRSGQVNQLLTGRLDGWRAAGWMFARHPVLGVGHGAYAAEFGDAKLALLARGTPFYPAHVYPSFGNAHNEVLEVAAEWGALGLAALAWGLWQVVRAVRRLGSPVAGGDAAAARRRAALAWSLLAALAVLSMAHFPFRLALTAFPALLLLAWIFAAGRPPAAAAEREGIAGRTLAWVLVPVLLVAVVAQGDRLRDRLRSGRILKTVEAVTVAVAAGGAPPPTLLWTHVRLLEEAAALAPADSGVPLAQGSQYLLLGRLPEAQQAYRRSLALSSRPEGWLNLGRAQWQAGERQAALDSFARATALNPRLAREVPRAAARELVRRR